MTNPSNKPQYEIICSTCFAHISGPANAPAHMVSHGICPACLKRDHPGAYYLGRRRAIDERLARGAQDTASGLNDLFFKGGSK